MTERNTGARVIGSCGYKVRAVARTDDEQVTVRFDAVDWFVQAADVEIRELHTSAYSGPKADAILYLINDTSKNNPFSKMLTYLRQYKPRRGDNTIIGFEVQVNRNDVCTWLLENRPELAAELFPGQTKPSRKHAVPFAISAATN